jgi:hypothetical protein
MYELKTCLERIASLTREDIGKSEENVKQKIVVPLLECLGHHRNQLDFEYGSGNKRIDIFIKELPIDCKVIIDTKNYDEDLSAHLEQIGLYAFQEGAILALVINGKEIRIYDPFFRGFSFRDSLLYSLRRDEITTDKNIEILHGLLSRENLENKKVKNYIIAREQEIMDAYSQIEEINKNFEDKKKKITDEKENLIRQIDEIQSQIKERTEEINQLDSEKDDEINRVLNKVGLPYIRTTPQEIQPSEVQELRVRNIYSKSTNVVEILLRSNSPKKFHLIPVPKSVRHFFPGYNVPFTLETDIGEIPAKVTSAPKGTKEGDPNAGAYIKSVYRNDLTQWYDKHKDLKLGDKILIEVIEDKRRYKLSVAR